MSRRGLVAFLERFRVESEAIWARHHERTLADFRAAGVGGSDWKQGTRWKRGLNSDEIAAIEDAHRAEFPQDYRTFLTLLNAPDRPNHRFQFQGSQIKQTADANTFTDWAAQPSDQQRAYEALLSGIAFDVEQAALWPPTWGDRPATAKARLERLSILLDAAPRLIRVHGHRFMVSGFDQSPAPVLSVHQSDVIVYAWSLEEMLVKDFPELTQQSTEAPENTEECYAHLARLPFWSDILG